ncbi:two-component sensor histidine kinase [Nocardioides flavus (ex Wang et al. 2016)]|uniref:histidine kinase n=1 Tax=Nocardioides flavus (ex Wang et al. 2016) TaxID=2058780 RepID=A0ABQ3HLX9_9ACTN|nr:histidine kinase [Nocardioides flavus (ex Wang et al. 2016)]GHE17664.1 two-component sensor histidine kinase [Nocardioides flavus (ex Wang et al. 2016)]
MAAPDVDRVRTGERPRWTASAWRYGLALAISGVIWGGVLIGAADRPTDGALLWFLYGDPVLGLVGFLLVRWRHRYPGPVATVVTLFACTSAASAGPAAWVLGSLASHRRWRLLAVVGPLSVVSGVVQERVGVTEDALPLWISLAFGALVTGILVATGYAMGSQRELVDSYRERALTAEREQRARVAQAQAAERTRIAREMHDVLAHRISLVAMHAGALGYRTDLTAQEQASAAKSIEENAHRALSDLRAVLGVLRDPLQPADAAPERPQPGLDDVAALVAEEAAGGMRVRLSTRVADDVPTATGRTAYRIVQEALTNVRKHAPGTAVTVDVAGDPDEGLVIGVRNAASVGPRSAPALPASGLGLIGLAERAALAGGRISHGTDATGGYAVRAWIPWDS